MPGIFESIPEKSPVLSGQTIGGDWYRWLAALLIWIQSMARVLNRTSLLNQTGAIGTTTLVVAQAGIYRVSWVLRITQPASVSSSVTVSVGYTDEAALCSQSDPLGGVTGNTVTTVRSGSVVVKSDNGPITFSTAYASVGATPMKYKLDLITEWLA